MQRGIVSSPNKDLVIGESGWLYALQVIRVPACVADGDTSLTNWDGDLLTPSTEWESDDGRL